MNTVSQQRWKTLWMLLAGCGIGLGAIARSVQPARANEPIEKSTPAAALQQIEIYRLEGRNANSSNPLLGQIPSASQFTDVKPTDWAFQALQSLIQRYDCIAGYPDRTYRGNRPLTRYEFAAGLNACADKIQALIAGATGTFANREDLEVLKRLQKDFAAELATLQGRVDTLEARAATLERQQFSPTTKLTGEAVFAIADTFGDAATVRGNGSPIPASIREDNTNTIFSNRSRLIFDSSFSGKDRLRVRLNAINITPFAGALTGTNQTRLSFDGNNDNSVTVDKLYYRFPVGDKLRVQVDAFSTEYNEGYVSTLSPFESAAQSAISRFSRFNPVLRTNSPGGAGITFNYDFSPQLALQGGFLGDSSSNVPARKMASSMGILPRSDKSFSVPVKPSISD